MVFLILFFNFMCLKKFGQKKMNNHVWWNFISLCLFNKIFSFDNTFRYVQIWKVSHTTYSWNIKWQKCMGMGLKFSMVS
jgi:hypothetical protein